MADTSQVISVTCHEFTSTHASRPDLHYTFVVKFQLGISKYSNIGRLSLDKLGSEPSFRGPTRYVSSEKKMYRLVLPLVSEFIAIWHLDTIDCEF
ncbi:unnamed protein product [Leptosia nina]|uniref:Uncharacterized protein n=1 Tax=Leptosia nina TaxID=320188 RepID=A0AAV1JYW9_9NEOP